MAILGKFCHVVDEMITANKSTQEEGARNVDKFGESGDFGKMSPRLLTKYGERINQFSKKGPEMLANLEFGESDDIGEISPRLLTKCCKGINQFRGKGPEMLANLVKTANLAKVAILAKFRQGFSRNILSQ